MSDKQINQLLGRVAKLEVEVEQLKTGNRCGDGLLGLFGVQKDNPLFSEVIAHIEAERAAEKVTMSATPDNWL